MEDIKGTHHNVQRACYNIAHLLPVSVTDSVLPHLLPPGTGRVCTGNITLYSLDLNIVLNESMHSHYYKCEESLFPNSLIIAEIHTDIDRHGCALQGIWQDQI